jgi:hypothetical protein
MKNHYSKYTKWPTSKTGMHVRNLEDDHILLTIFQVKVSYVMVGHTHKDVYDHPRHHQ